MSVLHQDSGWIGKSIPSALEISLGHGFCTPRPSRFPSGFALGKSLGSREILGVRTEHSSACRELGVPCFFIKTQNTKYKNTNKCKPDLNEDEKNTNEIIKKTTKNYKNYLSLSLYIYTIYNII